MKIQIKKTVGESSFLFETEGEKPFDALFSAAFFASTPNKCSVCNSPDVELNSNKAQDYKFVKVSCKDCYAQAQVGQYKDGGYFWKKFEKFEKDEKKQKKNDKDLDEILNSK